MLKTTVFLIVLIASTSAHAQQTPTSAWNGPNAYKPSNSTSTDSYKPPNRARKSAWNGSQQPPKTQGPADWWSRPHSLR